MKHKREQGRPDRGDSTLGDYVRRRRLAKGWTLDDAEAESNVDRTYWSKVETGVLRNPDPRYLARIAEALGAPLEDLYGLAGYTPAERLPAFRPYLRSRYHLPPEAIEQLEGYFAFLRHQYGIPESEPVFPRKDRRTPPKNPDRPERPTGGAWDDPDLGHDLPPTRRAA